jgi:hypothetical protein
LNVLSMVSSLTEKGHPHETSNIASWEPHYKVKILGNRMKLGRRQVFNYNLAISIGQIYASDVSCHLQRTVQGLS